MRRTILAGAIVLSMATVCAAADEDARTAIDLPPDVKVQFLEHMRTHMNSLNNVVQLMSVGKIREAGSTARKEMAFGQGRGFGRFMPPEFREMGFGFHKAAGDFARTAEEVPEPPDAAGWTKLVTGLADITARGNSCHAMFRVK
jgi:hypothetical protein